MTTVWEVREALANAVTDGCGLRCQFYVPDQMVAPIAVVSRRAFDPRYVFSEAKAAYQFTVTVYVDRTADRTAQKTLDDYCELSGSGSVIAAIQDGDLWSVDVDYAQVTQVGEVVAVAVSESQFLAVALDVEVVF